MAAFSAGNRKEGDKVNHWWGHTNMAAFPPQDKLGKEAGEAEMEA